MDKYPTGRGAQLLVVIVVLSILIVSALSFYRYLIKKDYMLFIKEPCDPKIETCFIHECDIGDVRCNSAKEGKIFYKIIHKNALNMPACPDGLCPQVDCKSDEKDCEIIFCSPDILENYGLSDTCSQ